jgi:glycosyltransferase involved in cell wall biosynthesis
MSSTGANMADERLVSVIIPCYNAAQWLPGCIESVLKQDWPLEIIIVDDASTDNSRKIILQYSQQYPGKIKAVDNTVKGGNNARNLGMQHASGAFIQWLDADDFLMPGKLQAQVNALLQSSENSIAYSDWELHQYDEWGRILQKEIKKSAPYPDYLYELLRNNWLPPHAYLLRRSVAEQLLAVKAWNPDTPISQDREYFTRAAILGAQFIYVPGFYSIYNRWHTQSVSRSRPIQETAKVIVRLLQSFAQEINAQPHFSETKKKLYRRVILTQIAYWSSLYNVPVNEQINLSDIKWGLISGMRSRWKVLRKLVSGKKTQQL